MYMYKQNWHNLYLNRITAQARVYCDVNFYGPECSVFCEPQNSVESGHFTCSEAGTKVCEELWHGPDCMTYCKPTDDETGHYDCGPNGEVKCHKGLCNL